MKELIGSELLDAISIINSNKISIIEIKYSNGTNKNFNTELKTPIVISCKKSNDIYNLVVTYF